MSRRKPPACTWRSMASAPKDEWLLVVDEKDRIVMRLFYSKAGYWLGPQYISPQQQFKAWAAPPEWTGEVAE